jgi:hypothetical protein
MYYVPDNTDRCGYYECSECGTRFLSLETEKTCMCPYCGTSQDMEIGPDEVMTDEEKTGQLVKIVEGAEEVYKMDTLLSLAITGGDYNWI